MDGKIRRACNHSHKLKSSIICWMNGIFLPLAIPWLRKKKNILPQKFQTVKTKNLSFSTKNNFFRWLWFKIILFLLTPVIPQETNGKFFLLWSLFLINFIKIPFPYFNSKNNSVILLFFGNLKEAKKLFLNLFWIILQFKVLDI